MSLMSKPNHRFKIPALSIPEVREPFDDALKALQRHRRGQGVEEHLPGQTLTNAIVLHFLALPFEEQAAIVEEFVPKFEMMCGDASPSGEKAPAYEDATHEVTVRVIRTTPPKGAPGKGARKGRGGSTG